MRKPLLALALALAACSRPPTPAGPISVAREPAPDGGERLMLVAEPGARISATYVPTLTLADGRIVEFDTSAVTADSAYFTAPPAGLLSDPPRRLHGMLKASVCPAGQSYCRLLRIAI
jgi:hypothetical protein